MNLSDTAHLRNPPPLEMRELRGWLVWRFIQEHGEPKPRKVPFYVRGRARGKQGTPEDRAELVTFEEAQAACTRGNFDGVGFCPMPEWGIAALDFDNCVVDGKVHADVERLVAGTYAELSPSGRGVRAFVRGDLGNRKEHGEPFGFETFSSKGYVTFTGRPLPITGLLECEGAIAPASAEQLAYCEQRFGGRSVDSTPASAVATVGLSAAQIQAALAALDPDCGYDEWLRVGMALHHETGGEGFELWDDWSSRGSKYPGRDLLERKWEGFGRGGQRPTTAHALVRMANEAGAQIEIAQLEAADDFDVIPHQAPRPVPEAAISFVDFASLQHTVPPPRRWVWDQWLPRGSTTVLYGRGGHGKSLLAQQLALCIAKGMPFASAETQPGPVLGLFAEDDADELLRRGAALYGAMGLEAGDAAGRLHLDARAGKFNTLVTFGTNHLAKPTSLMASLREQCRALRPVLIILDNIAQMYAGEENNRHEVTAFCNEVTGLAREFDCAALLLGHLAKSEESEYSGSTAWDAAVRSRLLLARLEDGTTVLRRVKANYSDRDEVLLEWRGGAFAQLPSARDADPETLAAVKPQIVRAMQVLTARKQAASHLKTARNYLVKLMREEMDLHASIRPEFLEAAMRAMLDSGELVPAAELPWKNSSRHAVTGLALP
jgi:KaiC/GvpD/RAD55 family RecA-like ATPase